MKKKLVVLLVVLVTTIFLFGFKPSSPSPLTKHCIVKLYTNTGFVQTWESLDFGQVDAGTLIFTVGTDVSPQRVRIHGTWTIEEKE